MTICADSVADSDVNRLVTYWYWFPVYGHPYT